MHSMNDRALRVLYLHPASAFGGASKSLIELFGHLRSAAVEAVIVTPPGKASELFARAGMSVRPVRGLSQFDNTRYGYYRRLRWLILIREILLLPSSLRALWQARREPVDLIHINEITLLPLGVLAKRLLRAPLVVHVRSVQRAPGASWRSEWINGLLRRHADRIIAIDHTVAVSLAADLAVHIVHNGLQIDQYRSAPRERDTSAPVKIGFLGVLIPLKGVFELVEAVRLLRDRGVQVKCLIAGENARRLSGLKAWLLGKLGFARDVRAELESFIIAEGLQEQIEMLGFVSDVRELYPQLDVLCFPSHLNAAGRPVFEAAFYSIPSVVAIADPAPDAVVHEMTGLTISAPEPVLIADALQRLIEDTQLRHRLGKQARAWAEERFSIHTNAARMLEIYRNTCSEKMER